MRAASFDTSGSGDVPWAPRFQAADRRATRTWAGDRDLPAELDGLTIDRGSIEVRAVRHTELELLDAADRLAVLLLGAHPGSIHGFAAHGIVLVATARVAGSDGVWRSEVLGCVCAEPVPEPPFDDHECVVAVLQHFDERFVGAKLGYRENLVVIPDARSLGVGSSLSEAARHWLLRDAACDFQIGAAWEHDGPGPVNIIERSGSQIVARVEGFWAGDGEECPACGVGCACVAAVYCYPPLDPLRPAAPFVGFEDFVGVVEAWRSSHVSDDDSETTN